MALYPVYPMYCKACGGVAFYTTKIFDPNLDEGLLGAYVIRLDGTHPLDGIDNVECGACGISDEFYYKKDKSGNILGVIQFSEVEKLTAKEMNYYVKRSGEFWKKEGA